MCVRVSEHRNGNSICPIANSLRTEIQENWVSVKYVNISISTLSILAFKNYKNSFSLSTWGYFAGEKAAKS
jgi:hypothetical protein